MSKNYTKEAVRFSFFSMEKGLGKVGILKL